MSKKLNRKIDLRVGDNSAESILSNVAGIIFGVFVVTAIAAAAVGFVTDNAVTGLLYAVILLVCGLITWAASMVIINISNNVRTIKYILAEANGMCDESVAKADEAASKEENVQHAKFKVGDKVVDSNGDKWTVASFANGAVGISKSSWANPKFVDPSELTKAE